MKTINHWINGKNVASKEYFTTTNPANGEVLAEVASGGQLEIDQAVAAAKEAFPKWANTPMKERARLMRRLGELIDQNVPQIAELETADTGLPIHQTKNVLIPRASHNFEFFAEVCQQMNGKTYPVDDKMLNYTLVQPVGVCALVSPWNVPFMTATWKTAPCLALGNTAVLKMSELSPLTADRLGELALEAGIPAGVLNVVQGYGATAGDALVRHKDVRAVSFTGGTATGRRIIESAGLKKFSMELGGKSPVLIFEDADIERALDAALFTIFSINGERCTAGSRIFIQESIYPEFVKRFAERANRLRVGDPQDPNTQVGALISPQHWEKSLRLYPPRGGRRGDPVGRRPGQTGRFEPRQLPAPDGAGGCRQPDARGAGRDLRAGGLPAAVQVGRRRPAHGQRRGIRPGVVHLDAGCEQGSAPGPRHRSGHGFRQHPKRTRSAPTVRRRESLRHRPRRRRIQLRSVRRNEERVHFHGRPPDPEMGRLSLGPQ